MDLFIEPVADVSLFIVPLVELVSVVPIEPEPFVPVPASVLVLGVEGLGVVAVLSLGLVLGDMVEELPVLGVVGVRPVLSAAVASEGVVVDGLPGLVDCA